MKRFFNWLRNRCKPAQSTPQIEVPALPPETNIEWDFEEVEFQRLPELPISKGRRMVPQAIVVHYTAGWQNQRAFDAISYMQRMGHGYLLIDKWGSTWQHIHLDESYAHAGASAMPSFSRLAGRSNVSSFSIGIEVTCGGQVNAQNKTWFGKTVESENIREASVVTHGRGGRFEKFTDAQEKSLINTIITLCRKYNIPADCVVGHHEISPTRRDDPAGALSMGMHRLRALVADELLK
jgi:N-acetyl-anhydromuramyl-L-alanine amidase AmpD